SEPDRLLPSTHDTPDYVKSIVRGDKPTILTLVTDDCSGLVCFDEFTQDTWIQLPETATLSTSTVEN
ncbi:MAG: hypothetical protein KJ930_12415, partial [Gammaproteobacteria bacterium]|nr:hypothetical protein [Gammaproteobacteria bacterium]MBU2225425.1 hypothetical protein [Gammaproteobacteria bacterium]